MPMTVEQLKYDTGVETTETTDNPYEQQIDKKDEDRLRSVGRLFRPVDEPERNFRPAADTKTLSGSVAEQMKDLKNQIAENKREIEQLKGKLSSGIENSINGDPSLAAALNRYGTINYNRENEGKKVDFRSSESAQEIAG
ncbi:MAG: hypothetical protein HG439_004355 [candidate division SR1 bacterium]|nr:hypothetical protein [candidate division SR1 bacterium]